MIIKGHQNRKYLHSINNFTKTKNIYIQSTIGRMVIIGYAFLFEQEVQMILVWPPKLINLLVIFHGTTKSLHIPETVPESWCNYVFAFISSLPIKFAFHM